MVLPLALLVGGLVFAVIGAELLVNGAASLGRKLGISSLVIGLTIVSFGTSAPELVVSLFASGSGNADVAIGNVLGSNIFNILVILGATALLKPVHVNNNTVWKGIPLVLLSAIVLWVACSDTLLTGTTTNTLVISEGLLFLAFFIVFMYYTFGANKESLNDDTGANLPVMKSSIFVALGLAGLIAGGKLAVDGAVDIAASLGLSQKLIGILIVGTGTSLPELLTSINAARKGHEDMAIGNIVGSNIFNVFFILGISSVVRPLPIAASASLDLAVNIIVSLMLFLLLFTGKGRQIERWEGILMLVVFAGYLFLLIAGFSF